MSGCIFFSSFGKFRAAVRTRALCIRFKWALRGGTQERSNANKRRRNKSLQNSDQIQICRRLLFIITISVASFREIDFALFSAVPFRSIRSVCNFISKIKRTRIILCVLLCFSWIISLWIYWCVAFEFSALRAIPSHRTRLIINVFIVCDSVWTRLNGASECVPIPIPARSAAGSRSKAFAAFCVCL